MSNDVSHPHIPSIIMWAGSTCRVLQNNHFHLSLLLWEIVELCNNLQHCDFQKITWLWVRNQHFSFCSPHIKLSLNPAVTMPRIHRYYSLPYDCKSVPSLEKLIILFLNLLQWLTFHFVWTERFASVTEIELPSLDCCCCHSLLHLENSELLLTLRILYFC